MFYVVGGILFLVANSFVCSMDNPVKMSDRNGSIGACWQNQDELEQEEGENNLQYDLREPKVWHGAGRRMRMPNPYTDTLWLLRYIKLAPYFDLKSAPKTRDGKISPEYVKSYYGTLLKEHEDCLWRQIEKEFGVSREDHQIALNDPVLINLTKLLEGEAIRSQCSLRDMLIPIDKHVQQICKKVAQDFNCCEYVTFHSTSMPSHFAGTDKIFVSSLWKNFLTPFDPKDLIFKGEIGHEFQHIIFKDVYWSAALKILVLEQGIKEEYLEGDNNSINRMRRFKEIRADIISSARNINYALGMSWSHYLSHIFYSAKGGRNHPDSIIRYYITHNIALKHGQVASYNKKIEKMNYVNDLLVNGLIQGDSSFQGSVAATLIPSCDKGTSDYTQNGFKQKKLPSCNLY